jgi:glutathionylspermidine amidase/synthetase
MQEAMEEAGIRSKIIDGVDGLAWGPEGGIVDADRVRVKWVWKTWAWETALDQLRAECEADAIDLVDVGRGKARRHAPRLVDVLLREEILVYEPLWTLIPSNKAILPVLSSMFPEYPYILDSSYTLTDAMKQTGYVVKPIVGRGGANITIVGRDQRLRAETGGVFEDRDQVYQTRFPLPELDGYFVQVSTFSAAGRYAGACLRVDETPVINMASENIALRVIKDKEALAVD